MDDFWAGILDEARRPPTSPVTTRPPLRTLQSARHTAERLTHELGRRRSDGHHQRAFRIIFQLMDDFRSVDPDLQSELVREMPDETGDARFDAYLAATVEHLAFHAGVSVPSWAGDRDALLPSFWFPSPYPGTHARALIESPAAFRRRGIFIEEADLHRV